MVENKRVTTVVSKTSYTGKLNKERKHERLANINMQMDRMTLKSSTIFVSVGKRTRVYRSLEEVPTSLRRQLDESTNSINSATILIADKRGREEIVRALRGLPSDLRSRLASSLANHVKKAVTAAPKAEAKPKANADEKIAGIPPGILQEDAQTGVVEFFRRYWAEFAVPAGVGVLIWLALQYAAR